jgi:hypothetical protein
MGHPRVLWPGETIPVLGREEVEGATGANEPERELAAPRAGSSLVMREVNPTHCHLHCSLPSLCPTVAHSGRSPLFSKGIEFPRVS